MCDEKRPVSVYMPETLIIESRVEAAKRNMSRSAFLVEVLEEAIRQSQQQRRGQQRGGQRRQSEAE
jgi:hypothetical protein